MLLIVGLLLLAACSPTPVETPEPTSPTAAATVQPAAPTPPQATLQPVVPTPTGLAPASAAGDDLAKAKAEGLLLVGSSLDNPPYSTYNEQYRPAGFDVAYITEIARRLGLRVDINDFTFEGLLDALKLKQVDAAIAAIDITPERASAGGFQHTLLHGRRWHPGSPEFAHLVREVSGRLSKRAASASSAARSTKAGC